MYTLDSASRVTKVVHPMGHEWSFTWDANGNSVGLAIKELHGTTSVTHDYEATYDALSRLAAVVEIDRTNAANRYTTSYEYSSQALVFKTDAEGNPTRWTLDGLSRIVKRERAIVLGGSQEEFVEGQVREYGFDKNNRLVLHKDDAGNSSTWSHDALDRATAMTLPNGSQVTYEYDASDNVVATTDPAGNVVQDTYDALDRNTARSITLATGFAGTTSESRSYDALSRIVSTEDNDYKVEYDYLVRGLDSHVTAVKQSYVGTSPKQKTVEAGL